MWISYDFGVHQMNEPVGTTEVPTILQSSNMTAYEPPVMDRNVIVWGLLSFPVSIPYPSLSPSRIDI